MPSPDNKTINASPQAKAKVKEIREHVKTSTGMTKVSLSQTLDIMASVYWTVNKRAEKKPEAEKQA